LICETCGNECQELETVFGIMFRVCPKCEADREKEQQDERDKRSQEAQLAEKGMIDAKIAQLGIGDRYIGNDFEDYQVKTDGQRMAKKTIQQIAELPARFQSSGKTVILHGISGTGKTMLVTILVQELVKQGRTVEYTTVLRMIRAIRQTFGHKEKNEQEAIDSYAKCSLLVIEEVGVKTATEYENSILFEILDDRYRYKLPTIITSNLDGKQLEAYFGERLWRRFKTQEGIILPFDWKID
jgi:DNA replication protein DnaC